MPARAQGWMTREGVFSPEIIPIEEMALWVCSVGKICEEVAQARLGDGDYLFGSGGLYNIIDLLQVMPHACIQCARARTHRLTAVPRAGFVRARPGGDPNPRLLRLRRTLGRDGLHGRGAV